MTEVDPVVSPIPLATKRVAALLVLIGVAMLSTGLGYGSALQTAVYVGVTMFVWTTLLPRLSVLRPLSVFFASHALAVAAYWSVLSFGDELMIVVGSPAAAARELRTLFVAALVAGALGLGAGLALDRAVRRGGERIRQRLGVAMGVTLVATTAIVVLAQGEAPRPIERLRAAPIVARIERGQRVARAPLALMRAADGAFTPVQPGNLDWLVSSGPGALSGLRSSPHVCGRIHADAPIEVREVGELLLYTEEHALDDADAWLVMGCAYHPSTLERVPIRTSDLEHPLSGSERGASIVLGALAVALLQVILAATALSRYARLERAQEGHADGSGTVLFADGLRARCEAPSGPVLVTIDRARTQQYRANAIPTAKVIARGTRAEADAGMHESTCIALVGAIGALLAVALPLAAALVTGFVAPL